MNSMFLFIYCQPLHNIVLCMIMGIVVWGTGGYVCSRKMQVLWRWFNLIVLLLSLGGILCLTVFNRTTGEVRLVLQPFASFAAARKQPEIYRTILMNIFLFEPIGLSFPFVLSKSMNVRKKVIISLSGTLILSILVEVLQFTFRLGTVETDDVIFNTLGAVIGTMACLIKHCLEKSDVKKGK